MLIEHSVPDSARMVKLPDNASVRYWLPDGRILTIQVVNDGTALVVKAEQAPGGHSYAVPIKVESNNFNSIVMR
jgi:hypothetical protein